MAAQDGLTFEGTFNNVTTGLYIDNTTNAISEADLRALPTAIRESYLNRIDDAYTGVFPKADTTGTNTYAVTLSPAITTYTNGMKIHVKIKTAATGASTLNANTVGAKKIFIDPSTQAGLGHLIDEQEYIMSYDSALDAAAGGWLIIGGGGGGSSSASIPFGSTSGTNTYTIAATPTVSSYADGDLFLIKVVNGSTGASTLNFDGVGAKKVYDHPDKQLSNGDFEDNRFYLVSYDAALDSAVGGFIVVGDLNHERVTIRNGYDASTNLFPATGGTGPGGAVKTGDAFTIGIGGTLGTDVVANRDMAISLSDTPGQTAGNWTILAGLTATDAKLALKAPLASPALTGTPTAPTAAVGTDTTQVATTAFVHDEVVGVQDLFIPASAMWPRVTGGCGPVAAFEMATSLFNVQALSFDQTTQEFAQCQIVLPRKWNVGTITVVPYWTATSGTGTVQWGISGGAYSNDDALTVALGTAQTSDDTLITTNDLHIGPATSAITLAGTPADADFLAIQISRNPASDTLTADALLLGISVRITTDAAIDA